MNSVAPPVYRLHWRIPALGVAQIVAWGTLYYAVAVLATPMSNALGLGKSFVYGCFTAALLISGALSPWVGRRIDRDGGRSTVAASAVAGGLAFLLLANAHGWWTCLLAWSVAGVAMGLGLYDAMMAVLNPLAPGARYRRAVTALTLFGGFASTVFWPLTHFLVVNTDWRMTCEIYALLLWGLCLPLYLLAIPRASRAVATAPAAAPPAASVPRDRRRFRALAAAFALVSFAFSVFSAHLVDLLGAAGINAADAILIGAAVGPTQVVARVVEYVFAPRLRAVTVGRIAFGLMAAALVILAALDGQRWLAACFALLYGASNGILTIVRGTVPAELFGREGYGALLGELARPSFVAKSLAPLSFALLVEAGVGHATAMAGLALVGAVALACYEVARHRA